MPDDSSTISPVADSQPPEADELLGQVPAEASARKLVDLYALLGALIVAEPTSAGFTAVTKVALAMVPGAEHASTTRAA